MKKLQDETYSKTLAVIYKENPKEVCICKSCWEGGTYDLKKVVALITSNDTEDWKHSKDEIEYHC